MTLRAKITEAAFWHESICLKCGCRGETLHFVVANCECPAGEELVVDAIEFAGVLKTLDAEGEE